MMQYTAACNVGAIPASLAFFEQAFVSKERSVI